MPEGSLGERIRALRRARGLSLEKVGGGDFSRAFLSQVELGRSQPSTRVLRIIADRLGTQVEYLLDGSRPGVERSIVLEQARLHLLRGDPARAWARLEPLLPAAEWPFSAEVRLAAIAALTGLGRTAEAKLVLDALTRDVEATGPADYWVERLEEARSGDPPGPPAGLESLAQEEARRADRLFREGLLDESLQHYQAARVLLAATARSAPPAVVDAVGRIPADLSGHGRRSESRRSSAAEPMGRR